MQDRFIDKISNFCIFYNLWNYINSDFCDVNTKFTFIQFLKYTLCYNMTVDCWIKMLGYLTVIVNLTILMSENKRTFLIGHTFQHGWRVGRLGAGLHTALGDSCFPSRCSPSPKAWGPSTGSSESWWLAGEERKHGGLQGKF